MAMAAGLFARATRKVAQLSGRPLTFCIAVAVIAIWAVSGPLFGFSDTWQLVINTSTTIITFLMVFLIQATQNRDTAALQLKLDELISREIDVDGVNEAFDAMQSGEVARSVITSE